MHVIVFTPFWSVGGAGDQGQQTNVTKRWWDLSQNVPAAFCIYQQQSAGLRHIFLAFSCFKETSRASLPPSQELQQEMDFYAITSQSKTADVRFDRDPAEAAAALPPPSKGGLGEGMAGVDTAMKGAGAGCLTEDNALQ